MPCGASDTIIAIRDSLREPDNRHEAVVIAEKDLLPYWLEMKIDDNQLSVQQADDIWHAAQQGDWPSDPESREHLTSILHSLLGNVSNIRDLFTGAKLLKDFRGLGEFREQRYNGVTYIIFKGNQRLRRIIRGTRYRVDNPLIIALGIGHLGLKEARHKGGALTMILLAPFNVGVYMTNDEKTMAWLAGTTGSDLVKVGIAGTIGTAAAIGTKKVTTIASAGIIAAAVVGGISSIALNGLDDSLGLTSKMVDEMEFTLERVAKKSDEFFVEAVSLPCTIHTQSRRVLDESIDALADEIQKRIKRGARHLMRRFVREHLYPGWFYSVSRQMEASNERIL